MESIVSIEWLKENLENPKLIVLYSNLGDENSPENYIKNSRLFDIKNTFSNVDSNFPNTFPTPKQFQENCKQLGINQDSIIVVYDGRNTFSSPRVWWMFRAMSFHNIAVLDGGLQAWEKVQLPNSKALTSTFTKGNFQVKLNTNAVKHIENIQQNLTTKEMLVLDARSSGRFNSTTPEPRKGLRSGHIPNSINIPYTEVLTNAQFKNKTELQLIFKAIPKNKPLVFSCGSGITACIILLAAHQILGNEMSIYDGSWTEWASLKSKH